MRLLCALLAVCGPLASEPLPGGGRLTLDSERDGSGAGPCLVIRGLPGAPRACARAPSEPVPAVHRPISVGPIVRATRRAPVELFGETGPRVHQVTARHTAPWQGERMVYATLVRVHDALLLAAAGSASPSACTTPGSPRAWGGRLRASGR